MPDADALVTAAALAPQSVDGKSHAIKLLDRAVALAPAAADIGLLDAAMCRAQVGCDELKREIRLRPVDPRNGNLWMAALQDAVTRADQMKIDRVLARMAQSSNFNLHFVALGRRFLAALHRVSPPPGDLGESADSLRQVQAMTLVAAFALPPMQYLVEACKSGASPHAARRRTCRAIADPLSRSDSLIANMIGLRLQELAARDIADRDDAIARRRLMLWKLSQWAAVTGAPAIPHASQITRMLAHENEVDGMNAVLRAARRSLEPPANWQPTR